MRFSQLKCPLRLLALRLAKIMRPEFPHPRIQYIRDLFAQEDEILKRANVIMRDHDIAINVGPEDGKLLQFLLKSITAKRVLEIGTLIGYSAIWIARALEQDGILYSIEKNPIHAQIARELIEQAQLDDIVHIIEGDARHVLENDSDLQSSFDFIFIDANKSAYPFYLEWSMKNIRKNGIIVADNSYLFDSVYEDVKNNLSHKMHQFNKNAAEAEGFCSIMIPTQEGLTILLRLV